VAKFGDRLFCRLASSLSNMIRQAGGQANEKSSLGPHSFRIQYFAFGNNLVVSNAIFGFGSAKAIP